MNVTALILLDVTLDPDADLDALRTLVARWAHDARYRATELRGVDVGAAQGSVLVAPAAQVLAAFRVTAPVMDLLARG